MALCISSLLIAAPASGVAGYSDVEADVYYTEAVQWAVDNRVTGLDDNCFAPDAAVSRGETALWIYNMQNRPAPGVAHSFTDITDDAQHDAVSWMANAGITTGTSPERFSPDNTLTRAQVAAFLHRLAGEPHAPAHPFTDVISGWQQNPVSWMANAGITTGTSPQTFSPDKTLTRAQLITFLHRYQGEPNATIDPTTPPTCNDRSDDRETDETGEAGGTDETGETGTDRGTGETGNDRGTGETGEAGDSGVSGERLSITVPVESPGGRCAAEISRGIYHWERCAWFDFRENPDYHTALSNEEAEELIQRIWDGVDVEGKPAEPPTSELVPAGSDCATVDSSGFIIGCYSRNDHHIRRLDSFNDTLLHEVTHALVSRHPTVSQCLQLASNDAYQVCVHNDIFRCVADQLYVRYAGIPTAGVCGTTTTSTAGDAAEAGWVKRRASTGALYTYTDADWHNRGFPYQDDWATLVVRCSSASELDVFLSFGSGYLGGDLNRRTAVSHGFYPKGYWDWDEPTRDAYTDEHAVAGRWYTASDNKGVFLPSVMIRSFVASALVQDFVYLDVHRPYGGSFGAFNFDLTGAAPHIEAVVDECGGTPDPWYEYRNSRNELTVSVEADWHDRTSPYGRTIPTLNVTCRNNGETAVFLDIDSGFLAGQYHLDNRIPVEYVFFPNDWQSWTQTRRQQYFAEHKVVSNWFESSDNEAAFLPSILNESFLDAAGGDVTLFMIVANYNDREFGRFLFDLPGLAEPLRRLTEECRLRLALPH
ncbi:MAG: S-layer homology domain-containing protein [Acidimicrobiaceae bacterium]|nr:S-layer homology domain-containing protein [Acidimicrobiia bacterium]MCY4492752.1 S-layer homology domain-containing protein [Acidimicrobiaceae bacterium]